MSISELIEELKAILKVDGDLPVKISMLNDQGDGWFTKKLETLETFSENEGDEWLELL